MNITTLSKLSVHEMAQAIKQNQNLYSKDELLFLALEWEKSYQNYLMSNLGVLASH